MSVDHGIVLSPLDAPGAPIAFNTLDPDAAAIEPSITQDWQARKGSEPGLEGAVTTQDLGLFAADCSRTLTWGGNGVWLTKAGVRQLREWLGLRGSTFRYEDDEGNDWTVEIASFNGDARDFVDYYRGVLVLHVLEMSYLLGEPYTGD